MQKHIEKFVSYNERMVYFEYESLQIYTLIHQVAMKENNELWRKFLWINQGNVIHAFLGYIAYSILHLSESCMQFLNSDELIAAFRIANAWYSEADEKGIFRITYSDSMFFELQAYKINE